MLFEDSMSLLWSSYYVLSLVVLVAVYFALAFLPRLPRLVITWCVAGAMWIPAGYQLPLVEEGEFYTGWAPAAMVSAVAFLENSASALRGGLLWLILGIALGACVGIALWWWRRPEPYDDVSQHQSQEEDPQPTRRREPVIN
ncbi:hypothetical protein [Vreelandella venusta]|uniref:Uncharacterized protein n=1 Tax=Vreelandella venusta TaxID=44935 RepID=A0ABX2BH45_9GAMM|nr:hypothetical protein [Halomonas venusta]AZM95388.1 hypothetical protein EI420_06675 [Halomonas venusta]NPT32674.1 hypothetical protein [Halomonas venusta]UQI41989.1 hypothetical protein M3L73_06950 [Halomonas venusta]WAM56786.1 hypothetical protein L0519_06130 [Halomonas venusta]